MPNNLDAEQALLGCMLIDNEILPEVLDMLTEDDFYQDSHRGFETGFLCTALAVLELTL